MDMQTLYLIVPLAPLIGALLAGLLGWVIGRTASHIVTGDIPLKKTAMHIAAIW